MSSEPQPPPSRRNLFLVGGALGLVVLVCGGGGLLAALGIGGWWYAQQPTGLRFPQAALEVEGAGQTPLPTPLVLRKVGDPAPAVEPVTWTVEPPTLALAVGGNLVPSEPGEGQLQACTEGVCQTLPLRIALVDGLDLSPQKVVRRIWRPTQLTASARWRGAEVHPPLRWSVADPSLASIDATGTLTPRAAGKTEIRVEGGGSSTGVPLTIWPEPPKDCTLTGYADTLGRVGQKSEQRACEDEQGDFCQWSASQTLADGGRLDEGGGWEWAWSTLLIPSADLDEAWEIAKRCMNLPPEVQALGLPELLKSPTPGEQALPLAGEWDGEPTATVRWQRHKVDVELPSACSDARSFSVEGGWIKLTVSQGC